MKNTLWDRELGRFSRRAVFMAWVGEIKCLTTRGIKIVVIYEKKPPAPHYFHAEGSQKRASILYLMDHRLPKERSLLFCFSEALSPSARFLRLFQILILEVDYVWSATSITELEPFPNSWQLLLSKGEFGTKTASFHSRRRRSDQIRRQ